VQKRHRADDEVNKRLVSGPCLLRVKFDVIVVREFPFFKCRVKEWLHSAVMNVIQTCLIDSMQGLLLEICGLLMCNICIVCCSIT